MWIDDLAPCTHLGDPDPARLAVGWLDPAQPFERGPVGPAVVHDRFVEVLRWAAVHRSVDAMRGFHHCQLDACSVVRPTAASTGRTAPLGFAQIEVDDGEGRSLVAPNLIVHYVEVHGYRPPEAFVRAALIGAWREPERHPGATRQIGPGTAIDEWSPELAAALWDHVAAHLGSSAAEVRRLVEVEVHPAEVGCRYTHRGLPSVAVVMKPVGAPGVKASGWALTPRGTRELASWIVEALDRKTR